jgi:dTDP-glucose pyrophosphorylase/CBS domain-containing protein
MIRISETSPYLCCDTATVREVLARLNATKHLFQLVVDSDGRLLGTVTDGDVRRAVLAGATLKDPVSACLHRNPIVGRVGSDTDNLDKFRRLDSAKPFLPILDDTGRVREVIAPNDPTARTETALVMAGGPGTRLGERTRKTPKPLLRVAERPILDYVLSALEEAGVSDIYISVHYLAEQIDDFVRQRGNRARVRLLHEGERRGTIGALALLPEPPRHPVLVVNGDVITRADLAALAAFHARHAFDATIGVARHEVDIPFGVVRHTADGLFERIDEKPRVSHFIASGMYLLNPAFATLVPGNRPMDMPELLNEGRALGLSIGLFPIHEYWIDVGQPHDLEAADRDLSDPAARRGDAS